MNFHLFQFPKLWVRAENVKVTYVPLNEGDHKFKPIVLTEKFTQVPTNWGGLPSEGHSSCFIVAGYKITPNCTYHDWYMPFFNFHR